mmetsp:Transcript_8596/g.21352  ORF Transcript_8596/g.21352 Transcript_8596/m.21352 type:complete len:225 (-) Transcript_8596:164-838(-)
MMIVPNDGPIIIGRCIPIMPKGENMPKGDPIMPKGEYIPIPMPPRPRPRPRPSPARRPPCTGAAGAGAACGAAGACVPAAACGAAAAWGAAAAPGACEAVPGAAVAAEGLLVMGRATLDPPERPWFTSRDMGALGALKPPPPMRPPDFFPARASDGHMKKISAGRRITARNTDLILSTHVFLPSLGASAICGARRTAAARGRAGRFAYDTESPARPPPRARAAG